MLINVFIQIVEMKKLKFLGLIIGISIFSLFMVNYFDSSKKETIRSDRLMNNNLIFEGVVIGMQSSTNHSFGILEIKVLKTNRPNFSETITDEEGGGIYPYKIKNGIAELYCTVSTQRKIGDYVKVVSNDKTIYYNPTKSNEQGSLYIINKGYNLNYVTENTKFK